jgi:hypothetical protein
MAQNAPHGCNLFINFARIFVHQISLNMIVASNNKTRSQRREETCLVTKSDFQSIRQSKREHDEFQLRQKRRMALRKTKERH